MGTAGGRAAGSAIAATLLGCVGFALAQGNEPAFTAPPGSAQATPSPVHTAPLPMDSAQIARDAVGVFQRTCLASVGDATATIDAAINAGLAPYAGGGGASVASLLGDTPGQVFAFGGATDVLLAVGQDGRCTVWASRADGPTAKQAFVAAIDAMRANTTVRPVRDRTIERAGGWRHQLGYDIGGARRFRADAVTLLAAQPGLQVLQAAPAGIAAPN
ncbi:MAG TPA: hypothetical protein VFR90_08155 [Methylibium sp.]|uniref:NMCC_0638 family (lipo)protein n=1 Tax=Methylibium sp. TaxID=2067992 RepID=UPI002DBD296B|nr:hypothetical protein [Methylibium sp.]HEU4459077.1 hypothetical protein [Methylibium sp.]